MIDEIIEFLSNIGFSIDKIESLFVSLEESFDKNIEQMKLIAED
jgi:DNA primase large subunit